MSQGICTFRLATSFKMKRTDLDVSGDVFLA